MPLILKRLFQPSRFQNGRSLLQNSVPLAVDSQREDLIPFFLLEEQIVLANNSPAASSIHYLSLYPAIPCNLCSGAVFPGIGHWQTKQQIL